MSIINIEIGNHKSGRLLNSFLTHTLTAKQSVRFAVLFYLLNICTSTIIKAIVMIVTDTRPAKSKTINCNNISTIHITSF